jgi:hypothetical protein
MGIHLYRHRCRGGGGLVIGKFHSLLETEWEGCRGVKESCQCIFKEME